MYVIIEIQIWTKAPKVIYWAGNGWSREPVAAMRFGTREEAERYAFHRFYPNYLSVNVALA